MLLLPHHTENSSSQWSFVFRGCFCAMLHIILHFLFFNVFGEWNFFFLIFCSLLHFRAQIKIVHGRNEAKSRKHKKKRTEKNGKPTERNIEFNYELWLIHFNRHAINYIIDQYDCIVSHEHCIRNKLSTVHFPLYLL